MDSNQRFCLPLTKRFLGFTAMMVAAIGPGIPGAAQLVPDATLGSQSSTVTTQGAVRTIGGGVRAGSNLFHSFQEFNIESGRSVYFNDPGVNNILTRVTGPNGSIINGKLGVNGNANLFLMNPHGIVFGAGASLDVRGSFVATTAGAFKFSDGSEFSATNPIMPTLLTIAVPLGVQRGSNQTSATITNQGNLTAGQDLTLIADRLALQGQLQAGRDLTLQATDTLQVRDSITAPFKAIAGGNLTMRGDRSLDILALSHPQTLIQAGQTLTLLSDGTISGDAHFVSQGTVQMRSVSGGLATFTSLFDPIITSAGDVDLALNYSGASLVVEAGGNIRLQGNVTITSPDAAAPFVGDDTVLNSQPGLVLRSNQTALRYLSNSGTVAGSSTGAGLVPNPGITVQGDVTVAPSGVVRLTAAGTGNISTQAITAPAGTIALTSDRAITTQGQPLDVSTSIGNAGSIRLTALNGNIATGDLIASSADANSGNGGAVTISAAGSATLGSIDTDALTGNGAGMTITAGGDIRVGDIITYSDLTGDSGNATITAGGSIALDGIDTGADGGKSGNATIKAGGDLTATKAIDTSTYGAGDAGEITVAARSLFLNQGAQIRSISNYKATGNGGDIHIDVADTIKLSGVGAGGSPSAIFTLADLYSTGNGGDITINTGSLIMRDGSEILANHFGEGVGTRAGNITIRARDSVSLEGFRVRPMEGDSPGTGIGSNVSIGFNSVHGIDRQGGTIDIQTGALEVLNGAYISSSLEFGANGQGGNIRLNISKQGTPGTLTVAGSATRESGIFSRTTAQSVGNGGNIQIDAGAVSLQNHATIGAEANGTGTGGQISLNTTSLAVGSQSKISAETTTASNAGAITLSGDRLDLTAGGQIRTRTSGAGQAGTITLGTTSTPIDQITLNGRGSAILADTQSGSSGNGGNIALFTAGLSLTNRARISVETAGQGSAGNIAIQAMGPVSLTNASIASGVIPGSTGNGGEINVAAQSLTLTNRGRIQSLTLGPGNAGDIQVQAKAIAIADTSVIISGSSTPSQIGAATGNGGNIRLSTDTLRVFNNSIVSASTFGNGRSGNIDVTANAVELSSRGQLSATTESRGNAGSITVSARDRVTILGAPSGIFANTGPQSSGNGGSIFLTTGQLLMQDRARVTVDSRGRGKGGDIRLFANQVAMDKATIFAETASTQGGNIHIQARDLLLLRHNSLISASAGTAQAGGNGGNITIGAGFVVGVLRENSDITANAFFGNGGQVNINAQGIFGLRFQPRLTPFSDITASSQFGLSGTVTLNTPNTDPSRGAVQLPGNVTDPTNQIAQTCSVQQQRNSFVVTGRGGLSPDPTEALNQTIVWAEKETRGSAEKGKADALQTSNRLDRVVQPTAQPAIVEATRWIRNTDGSVVLVADTDSNPPSIVAQNCQSTSLERR